MAETWIRLLGPPRIESADITPPQPRGRKAWAVLAYLALSELRRTIGGAANAGDPLRLELPATWHCDVLELVDSATSHDADPRTFDGQLLEGLTFADSPVFDSWLADQRYRLDN
ncbi:hypothetical protein [Arthrobacter sp. UYCu712]|uniref:hypothetical protein n=1 Tax=Arthrobacter sp. UYCu712 TaxID=3156340 RepID=UPI00339B2767